MSYIEKKTTRKKISKKMGLTEKSIEIREKNNIITRIEIDSDGRTILYDEMLSCIKIEVVKRAKIKEGRSLRELGESLNRNGNVDNLLIERLNNLYDEQTAIDNLFKFIIKQSDSF